MALDGVTSFLRLKDVTITRKRMQRTLSFCRSSSVQWRKVGRSCRLQMCFRCLLCVSILGRIAQSVTCLATDACLTADPGVASSIPARYHTFVEIDHEIISTVILLPSADLFKKGFCQLQAKVCAQITG